MIELGVDLVEKSAGFEVMIRRLHAASRADTMGNWNMACNRHHFLGGGRDLDLPFSLLAFGEESDGSTAQGGIIPTKHFNPCPHSESSARPNEGTPSFSQRRQKEHLHFGSRLSAAFQAGMYHSCVINDD